MMGERRRQGPKGSTPPCSLACLAALDGNGRGSFVRFVFMLVTSDDGGKKKGTCERHWISIVRTYLKNCNYLPVYLPSTS